MKRIKHRMKIMWTAEIQILNEEFDRRSGNCIFKQFRQMSLPAHNEWVFIAQLLEHCSANTETMSSNPVEVPTSFQVNLQLLQFPLRRSYLH